MADISKIKTLDGTTYDLKDAVARYHLPYGVCETERAEAAKTVSIDGITELTAGLTIAIKFTNSNTGSNPTLNVNNLGAKSIMRTGELPAGTANETTGWDNGSIVILVYDGSAWLFNKGYNSNTTYAVSNVDCISSGLTANKVSTNAAHYVLKTGNIFEFTLLVANTAKSNLTLNINNTGAKPIYINGAASSSSNYTLPAGKYLVRYDGTAYQFRTDGKVPIDIQGTVNGYSINKSVPSNAVFTDTVIEPATEAPLANMDATVGTSLKYAREDHRHPATKIPPIWCDTLPGESAKVANGNSGYFYSLREGNLFTCEIYYGNTAQSALTFRVGTTSVKPIYINGTASSSTNYTLPAGSYLVYYDGTAYHFRTDGKIPGPITNNATSSAAGLMSAADKSKLDVITGVAVTDTEPTSDSILAWIDTDSTDTVTLLTQSEVNAQYVSYDHSQTLTSAQQNRALQNVGVTNGTDAQKTNLATFAGISLTVVGTI